MAERSLVELRGEIDAINASILEALDRRAMVLRDIARVKAATGLPLRDPLRERAQVEALLRDYRGPYRRTDIDRIFSDIFAAAHMIIRSEQAVTCVGGTRFLLRSAYRTEATPHRIHLVVGGGWLHDAARLERLAPVLASDGVGALRMSLDPADMDHDRAAVQLFSGVCRAYGLTSIVEVTGANLVEALLLESVDAIQIDISSFLRHRMPLRNGVLLNCSSLTSPEELERATSLLDLAYGGIIVWKGDHPPHGPAAEFVRRELRLPVAVDAGLIAVRESLRDIVHACATAAIAALFVDVCDENNEDSASHVSEFREALRVLGDLKDGMLSLRDGGVSP